MPLFLTDESRANLALALTLCLLGISAGFYLVEASHGSCGSVSVHLHSAGLYLLLTAGLSLLGIIYSLIFSRMTPEDLESAAARVRQDVVVARETGSAVSGISFRTRCLSELSLKERLELASQLQF